MSDLLAGQAYENALKVNRAKAAAAVAVTQEQRIATAVTTVTQALTNSQPDILATVMAQITNASNLGLYNTKFTYPLINGVFVDGISHDNPSIRNASINVYEKLQSVLRADGYRLSSNVGPFSATLIISWGKT